MATRLFVDCGYGRVTVTEIAKAADIAVPTVYASTGGKSAILNTILEQGMADPIVDETMKGGAWHLHVDDLGLSWDQSEKWLSHQASQALLDRQSPE